MVVMSIETNEVLPETVQNHSNVTTLNGFSMKESNEENSTATEKLVMDNTCAMVEMIPPVKTEIDDGSIESLLVAPVETILSTSESNAESHSPLDLRSETDDTDLDEDEEEDGGGSFNTMLDSISVNKNPTSNKKPSVSDSSLETGRDNRTNTVYHDDANGFRVSTNSETSPPDFYSRRAEDIYYDPERIRKVKFCDPLVTGSNPAKVFQRSGNETKESLVTLYRQSCEALRIRPLSSLISCIERAKSLDDRLRELSLKGERVDSRVTESLEVVLQNAQFVVLDLENCYLDDGVAITLFEMIEYYESATKIKIGANNKLSQYAWMYLCQLIKKCPFIDLLDCSFTELQDGAAILIARAIRNNCNLVALHLMSCRMSGKYLNYLVVGLRSNYILQELYLGDNGLTQSDALLLSQLLKLNFKLQCLDLRNNNLGDRGAALIFEGLKEQSQTGVGLVSLILWNNNLSGSCHYVVNALAAHMSLETLNMGYNDLRNDGISILKDGLLKNKSIARLGLSSTRIDSIGAIALAEFIAESRSIVRLDIRNNNLKVAGIMALQNALKNNYTLTRLDLDTEPKKEQLQGYAELYRGNLEQILFLLERNQTFATEEDTRRAILQQQILSYRRPLNNTSFEPSRSAEALNSPTGPTNQTENAKPSTAGGGGGLAPGLTLTSSLSSTDGDHENMPIIMPPRPLEGDGATTTAHQIEREPVVVNSSNASMQTICQTAVDGDDRKVEDGASQPFITTVSQSHVFSTKTSDPSNSDCSLLTNNRNAVGSCSDILPISFPAPTSQSCSSSSDPARTNMSEDASSNSVELNLSCQATPLVDDDSAENSSSIFSPVS